MKSRIYLVALVGLALMLVGSETWARCYVDQNAKGRNNGSTWADAYVHPQLALINSCTEIWVAKGVYTPVLAGSDPTVSFDIPAGTKMYGGFEGGESSVDQRLPSRNLTVLSGDVDHDDLDPGSWMDRTWRDIVGANSYHIIAMQPNTATPITSDTVLDGFLIVGGYAPSEADEPGGGGVYCRSDDKAVCGPTLSNLIFVGNGALGSGGAITFSKVAANPKIINSIFRRNNADGGGAIYIGALDSLGSALISNCAFTDNAADVGGGAIEVENAKVDVVNTTFFNNESIGGSGGAINLYGNAPLSVKNVTFVKNSAGYAGGAVSNGQTYPGLSPGTIFVTNSIFWSNSALDGGAPDIADFAHNFAYVASSILEHDCPDALSVCLSVSTADPKLSSPADHGGSTITLLPGAGASAIDTGDDGSACPPTDQRGVPRPQGAHCDIGAVEWRPSDDIIFRNGFQ